MAVGSNVSVTIKLFKSLEKQDKVQWHLDYRG